MGTACPAAAENRGEKFPLKPGALVVGDEIALDQPRDVELRFHPKSRRATHGSQAFLFDTPKATLRLELLTPNLVQMTAEDVPAADRHGADKDNRRPCAPCVFRRISDSCPK